MTWKGPYDLVQCTEGFSQGGEHGLDRLSGYSRESHYAVTTLWPPPCTKGYDISQPPLQLVWGHVVSEFYMEETQTTSSWRYLRVIFFSSPPLPSDPGSALLRSKATGILKVHVVRGFSWVLWTCWKLYLSEKQILSFVTIACASLMTQLVKNLPVVQETQEIWVQSLGWEDVLEEEMATQYSILTWKIPWTEEPGRLQSTG